MAVHQVRQPGEHDPSRHALGQGLAEGDAAVGGLLRLLRPLFRREPQGGTVAEAARDAVHRRVLVIEQCQERRSRRGHARRDLRSEGERLASPGDAPERP